MPRPKEFEHWPYRHCWFWIATDPRQGPGRVRIADVENMEGDRAVFYDVHVRAFDKIAQKYMADRKARTGQVVTLPDLRNVEIPYEMLDDDADQKIQRGMRPHPDQSPFDLVCRDGTKLKDVPRNWYEGLVDAHLQRRMSEPPITLRIDEQRQLTDSFAWYDAICKDFMRRRPDLLAAGYWPELLITERPADASKPGPLPVDGRSNALGQGAKVLSPVELEEIQRRKQAGGGAQGGVHPALENQDVI